MKLRAERTQFEEAVKWVQRTVGEKVSFPAMAGIKLVLDGDRLVLSSTDGAIDSVLTVPVQGQRDGGCLVSGKLLSNVVHVLPNDAVELEVDADNVHLACGRASFDLKPMVADDFPLIRSAVEDLDAPMLKAEDFAGMIGQVAKSASTDPARAVLTGVKLDARAGHLTAAATDSYRLAVRTMPWDNDDDMTALVPRRALEQARHAAELLGSDVRMVLESSHATFQFSDRRLVTSLIEGKYPDYTQLIPAGYDRRIIVDRIELAEVVRRIAVVGEVDRTMTPVVFDMSADTLVVKALSTEAGQAEESLPIELEGEPLTIAFNPRFLVDGLDAVGTDRIAAEFRDELKPAVLRPPTQQEDDVPAIDFLYLLMPVRV